VQPVYWADVSPAISVVVTCYDYGKFLDAALESVWAQSFEDWECTIVDDGSRDNTGEIAQRWTQRDQRFRYIRQDNSGVATARNAGLSASRGRYIQFLDADDMLAPEKFRVQIDLLNALTDQSLVYSSFQVLDDSLPDRSGGRAKLASPVPKRSLLNSFILDWERGFSIAIHGFLFRREHLDRAGGFGVDLVTHNDLDLYLKLVLGGVSFVHHPDVFAIYRNHGEIHRLTRGAGRMHQGYLLALGHASRRSVSRRARTMILYRYCAEVERSITDVVRRRQGLQEIRQTFQGPYRSLSALGLALYPAFFLQRILMRLSRGIGIR
jgi:glycosyltransferase involved in cell wall biosynthesis